MNDLQVRQQPPTTVPKGSDRPSLLARTMGWLGHLLATAVALAFLGGIAYVGQANGWAMPKFATLLGHAPAEKDDWCETHSVPDSLCVECRQGCMPRGKDHGWCRVHGVHECPWCNPDVAQLSAPPSVSQDDLDRAQHALEAAPRPENNSKCKLHERRIQFTSAQAASRLGLAVTPAARGPVTESVQANGEIRFDPARVARLAARAPGTVWRVEKQVGDRVARGEILALVDAAEVGKAKAEFQQALVHQDLVAQNVVVLRGSSAAFSSRTVQEAETALEEARVRMLTARQALANLGFPEPPTSLPANDPEGLARQLRFLGLPDGFAGQTASSNLIPVRSPLDGQVVAREAVAGEVVDTGKVLFVVADTRQLWLLLNVKLEDARRLRPGLPVRFGHEGHAGIDTGTVAWISPSADEHTRTVPVRVELPNADGRHHAQTFGTAEIILREESQAIVVPAEAVHWEGDCHVVFVRDKRFDDPNTPKVFHVRSVRPGATDGRQTEIIAGVLPGELVASTGSGLLRSELLKNNLGAG